MQICVVLSTYLSTQNTLVLITTNGVALCILLIRLTHWVGSFVILWFSLMVLAVLITQEFYINENNC